MPNNGVIDIPGGADIEVHPANTINLTTVTITRVVAVPPQRKIFAMVKEVGKRLVIYEGADYDALNGMISMADVETRVKEELGIGSSSSA